jgi:hypothetical protein
MVRGILADGDAEHHVDDRAGRAVVGSCRAFVRVFTGNGADVERCSGVKAWSTIPRVGPCPALDLRTTAAFRIRR